MTDVRKVVTGTLPRQLTNLVEGNPRHQYKTVESDKPLYPNVYGIVEKDSPSIWACNSRVSITSANNAERYSMEPVHSGSYYRGTINLSASNVGPPRRMIIFDDGAGAAATWTLPTFNQIFTYLRTNYPDMVQPGISWKVEILNDSPTHTLTLATGSMNAVGQTIYRYCLNSGNNHDLAPLSSCKLRFNIISTVLGAEQLEVFRLN